MAIWKFFENTRLPNATSFVLGSSMKPLILLIAISGTCFAGISDFDAIKARNEARNAKNDAEQMQRDIQALKSSKENVDFDKLATTPAATAEEQKLKEQIMAEKLKSMQLGGQRPRIRKTSASTVSPVDLQK
jgi:hypothetical protein